MKFYLKQLLDIYKQIRRYLWVCLDLLKKSFMENLKRFKLPAA